MRKFVKEILLNKLVTLPGDFILNDKKGKMFSPSTL